MSPKRSPATANTLPEAARRCQIELPPRTASEFIARNPTIRRLRFFAYFRPTSVSDSVSLDAQEILDPRRTNMTYWLDLFTGETWKQFRAAGGTVSGYRQSMRSRSKNVKAGDVFLCYLTGVMRWVGALEVIGRTDDTTPIWSVDAFPVRFKVKPLVLLDPEVGVPMMSLEGKLSFFQGPHHRGGFKGFVRMSPNRFRDSRDGDLILKLLREAEANPVSTPVDPKQLARRPRYIKVELKKGKSVIPTVVSVPEPEPEVEETPPATTPAEPAIEAPTRHTEIQYHLLQLGVELGLDVWVARNDRSRTYGGNTLGLMPSMLDELPTQFNEATTRTIELIDVLWLKGNSIIAAFEVESTTSIYSGLLRMSDLLSLQPNLDIQIFLVAPEERRGKVAQEIRRPTFAYRERPLPKLCGFLAFEKLMATVNGIRSLGLATSLKPDFLKKAAEFFADDDDA